VSISSPQISKKLTLSQLESFLWASANILRTSLDAAEYKDYIEIKNFQKDQEWKEILIFGQDTESQILRKR